MWDLPGPGLEPVSPALAGGFLTTAPPGKSISTVELTGDSPVAKAKRRKNHYRTEPIESNRNLEIIED